MSQAPFLQPIPWGDLHRDTLRLAHVVKERYPNGFSGLIAISRGGLVPTAILARELNIRTVESLCVASYDGRIQGKAHVVKPANSNLVADGTGWLVIDDLCDSGETARLVRQMFPHATIATVYGKPLGISAVDCLAVTVPQHHWLVFPWEEVPT